MFCWSPLRPRRARSAARLPGARRASLAAALAAVVLAVPALAATGPDVASYQHGGGSAIDWSAVRGSGQRFAWIKATEGTGYHNPWFSADWSGSSAAGLYRGAYHFARPSSAPDSAAAQARAFASLIGDQTRPGTLPPALDLEVTGGLGTAALTAWTRSFLTTLQAATGRRPVLYTYVSFWRTSMGGTSEFNSYPLWIANYTSAAQPAAIGWPSWTFWQYSDRASIRGIGGGVDINRFNGSDADLAALALDTPALPAPAVPAPPVPTGAVTGVGIDGASTGSASTGSASTGSASTGSASTGSASTGSASTGSASTGSASTGSASTGSAGSASTGSGSTGGPASGTAAGRYIPVPATRLVDTRTGTGGRTGRLLGALDVTLPASVPASAASVVLDVSAVDPAGNGWVRSAATGQQPLATVVNYTGGRSTTSLVLARLDRARRTTLTTYGAPTHLAVDLVGYYATGAGRGGHYVPLAPSRIADTRSGTGAPRGTVNGALPVRLPAAVPAGARAAVLNVSVVRPAHDSWLRVSRPGEQPTTTVMNIPGGQSRTGLVLAPAASRDVALHLFNGPAHVVVDLLGYYEDGAATGSSYVGTSPVRLADTRSSVGAVHGSRSLELTLPAVVPAGASAAVLALTAVGPDGDGYARLSASGTPAVTTALTWTGGASQTVLALTAASPDRRVHVQLFGGATDVVIDVVGYQGAAT